MFRYSALHARHDADTSPLEPRVLESELDEYGDSLRKEVFGEGTVEAAAAAAALEPALPAHAELATPGPVPTTPAVTPPELQVEYTSSNFGKQWKLLDRVAKGPRAKAFPNIAELWSGDAASKQHALKMYMQSDESLQHAESRLVVEKSHAETTTYRKAWLTIAQMQERGFSQNLVCIAADTF